ncbi:hypothetical protein ACIQU4_26950 [Streptomyces sp. NPDC090741]
MAVAFGLPTPPRPSSQAGTGSSSGTVAHSASVMSDGYRRARSG